MSEPKVKLTLSDCLDLVVGLDVSEILQLRNICNAQLRELAGPPKARKPRALKKVRLVDPRSGMVIPGGDFTVRVPENVKEGGDGLGTV